MFSCWRSFFIIFNIFTEIHSGRWRPKCCLDVRSCQRQHRGSPMAWGEVWHHRGREGEDWDGRFLATHWQMLAGIGAPLMQYDPSEPRSRVQGSTDLLVGIGTCLIWVHGSTFKMKGPAVFGHFLAGTIYFLSNLDPRSFDGESLVWWVQFCPCPFWTSVLAVSNPDGEVDYLGMYALI